MHKNNRFPDLSAIFLLMVLGCVAGCSPATPSPEPIPIPSPTTEPPTPTELPTATPAGPQTLLLEGDALPEHATAILPGGEGEAAITDIAWSPDGMRVAWPREDGVVLVDVPTGLQVRALSGSDGAATSLDWSPDGERIAAGSADGAVVIWDAESGEVTMQLVGHHAPVDHVMWSDDGAHLVSVASMWNHSEAELGGEVIVWDAANGEQLLTFEGHTYPAAVLPDDSLLMTTPEGMTLVGLPSGDPLPFVGTAERLEETYAPQWTGAVSPDGTLYIRTLIQAHGTGSTAEAASLETGEIVWSQEARYATIGLWAWSPDGARVAMGGPNIVVIRDGETGRQANMLVAEMGDTTALAWSPDSRLIATGSGMGAVVIWVIPAE